MDDSFYWKKNPNALKLIKAFCRIYLRSVGCKTTTKCRRLPTHCWANTQRKAVWQSQSAASVCRLCEESPPQPLTHRCGPCRGPSPPSPSLEVTWWPPSHQHIHRRPRTHTLTQKNKHALIAQICGRAAQGGGDSRLLHPSLQIAAAHRGVEVTPALTKENSGNFSI